MAIERRDVRIVPGADVLSPFSRGKFATNQSLFSKIKEYFVAMPRSLRCDGFKKNHNKVQVGAK